MSDITELLGTGNVGVDRGTINENFSNLNDDVVDAEKRLGNIQGSGVIKGGIISTTLGTEVFKITKGSSYYVDNWTDPENPVKKTVTWLDDIDITPDDLATVNTQFIGKDLNGLTLQFNTLPSPEDMKGFTYLGKLLIDDVTKKTVIGLTLPRMKYGFAGQFDDLVFSLGIINIDGNNITANGDNLKANRSAGMYHRVGADNATSHKNPSLPETLEDLAFEFSPAYRTATGFTSEPLTDTFDPTLWDDANNLGTLQTVPAGKFTVQNVYHFTAGTHFVTYGQKLYDSLNEALLGVTNEMPVVEEQFTTDASLRATIVLEAGATSLLNFRKAKIAPADKFGHVCYPGGELKAVPVDDAFISSGADVYYAHGFYKAPDTAVTLNQASPSQIYGSANQPYGAHAFVVAGATGTASGGVGAVQIIATGTSMDDNGVRTPGDTEVLVADITSIDLNKCLESNKKWIGQPTFTVQNAPGSTQTLFSVTVNYGLAKYVDWGNKDVILTQFTFTGVAGNNGANLNIELMKHQVDDWTFSAGSFIPGDGVICSMAVDYVNENDVSSGEPIAYKRVNLEEMIKGSLNEGALVRITTPVNNAIRISNARIVAEYI